MPAMIDIMHDTIYGWEHYGPPIHRWPAIRWDSNAYYINDQFILADMQAGFHFRKFKQPTIPCAYMLDCDWLIEEDMDEIGSHTSACVLDHMYVNHLRGQHV